MYYRLIHILLCCSVLLAECVRKQARGSMLFQSFPSKVLDSDGNAPDGRPATSSTLRLAAVSVAEDTTVVQGSRISAAPRSRVMGTVALQYDARLLAAYDDSPAVDETTSPDSGVGGETPAASGTTDAGVVSPKVVSVVERRKSPTADDAPKPAAAEVPAPAPVAEAPAPAVVAAVVAAPVVAPAVAPAVPPAAPPAVPPAAAPAVPPAVPPAVSTLTRNRSASALHHHNHHHRHHHHRHHMPAAPTGNAAAVVGPAITFFQVASEENSEETPKGASEDQPGDPALVAGLGIQTLVLAAFVVALALLLLCLARLLLLICRTRAAQKLEGDTLARCRVKKLRISSGKEIQSMFGVGSSDNLATLARELNPMSPGLLMRLRGHVTVGPGGGKTLTAPLTSRPCVMYSASVSHAQDVGVHRPPVAFHSAGTDFALRIESDVPGAQPLFVTVTYRDVKLFNMVSGRHASQQAFAEVPTAGRAFIMSHIVPGSDVSSGAAAGSVVADGILDFRECILAEGCEVTAVGEIARDGRGGLHLCPWTSDACSSSISGGSKMLSSALQPAVRLSGAWAAMTGSALKGATTTPSGGGDPAVGNVMVSDDPSLLGSSSV